MGREFAFLALTKTREGIRLGMYTGTYHREDDATRRVVAVPLDGNTCYLKVQVESGGTATFSYSLDDRSYRPIGTSFQAVPGVWIGAKVGLFSVNPNIAGSTGYGDFEWFRIE